MSEILYIINAGGAIMYPLLLLALLSGTVIIERYMVFFKIGNSRPQLAERIIQWCKKKDYETACKELARIPGPQAAALLTVLQHRDKPVETIERHVQEVGEEYFIALERRLSFLDTATTVSPLLGLLGTIVGMIGAFKAISAQNAGSSNDQILHGVAEALYATAAGISIAVVCFILYNFFSSRIRLITGETETGATRLINELTDQKTL